MKRKGRKMIGKAAEKGRKRQKKRVAGSGQIIGPKVSKI
jgi:hypothetical protein